MDERIRFRDLTDSQKKSICNGCGGKGGFINTPQFLFKADCNQHDFNYWLGCTEADRKKADKQFYSAMKDDVKRQPVMKRPFLYMVAFIYYKAVRVCGIKFFHYASLERTSDDLP